MAEVQKYRVKESWIFNLESMHDKLYCIKYDLDDGKRNFPLTIAGTEITDDNGLYRLIEECETLEWIAKARKVTASEYERIKEVVNWRVTQRYLRCLGNGMAEKDAGECFFDL